VNPWKAAPLHKKGGFLHIFSRMQSSIDGMLSAAPAQGDKPSQGAQPHRETVTGASLADVPDDAPDREDSKQEWGEVQSLRKKQLPPIRAAPGTSSSSRPPHASAPLQTKPVPSHNSIFEKTLEKLDVADSTHSVAAVAAGEAVEAPAVLAQAGLSAETLLRSRISPVRSSGVKRLPLSGAESPGAMENSASLVPVRMGGSPVVPRGALISVNTSKSVAGAAAVARNSSSSEASATPPSSSAAAGAVAEESTGAALHSLEKKTSMRFSDIGAAPIEEAASRKHKESVAAPPLRYTMTSDTATASTATAAGLSTPVKGTAEAGTRTTFTYAPPAPVAAAAAAALNDASTAAGPHADEEEEVPIAQVFFLAWPELYLEGVQSLIMIIALYIALYFTNFVAASHNSAWKVITLIPAVVCSVLLVYITKCAVMLASIHAVDCDAILEVLEQTEGAVVLSALIKRKVIALLGEMGPDPQAELVNLFSQIDSDGSGSISRDEFAEYMNSIEIHFDRRRWMQVFRSIDTTFDNKVQRGGLQVLPFYNSII
jgi:hypothetical protein